MKPQPTPYHLPKSAYWRKSKTRAARVIVDADAYYRQLADCLGKARREVLIVGWDFDINLNLVRFRSESGRNISLKQLLVEKAKERPEIKIRILIWGGRFLKTKMNLRRSLWRFNQETPANIEIRPDWSGPISSCHHQKIVVIDRDIGFCGGMDLTIGRWDTRDHARKDKRRRNYDGSDYDAHHDLQMMLAGEGAVLLACEAARRWKMATGKILDPVDPMPDDEAPQTGWDFENTTLFLSRTLPPQGEAAPVREIETLYKAAIKQARRYIYIENQYLTSRSICDALVDALQKNEKLQILVLGPQDPEGLIENLAMKAGRAELWNRFKARDFDGRIILAHPVRQRPDRTVAPIFVHSKLMIVDDRFLTLGSANTSNRSMSWDSECNISLLAETEAERERICAIRDDLIAEHSGLDPATVGDLIRTRPADLVFGGTLRSRILAPLPKPSLRASWFWKLVGRLVDPAKPK